MEEENFGFKEYMILIFTLAFAGYVMIAVDARSEKSVVKAPDINKHQRVERNVTCTDYQGRQRVMPAGMKSPIDRMIDPLGELIDPYGIF